MLIMKTRAKQLNKVISIIEPIKTNRNELIEDMPLKLMYITNRPEIAQIAETAGVDRIFVDMEYIGKADRQGGMDTVQSHHTIEDVRALRAAIETAELLVRVNPIPWQGRFWRTYCKKSHNTIQILSARSKISERNRCGIP